MFGLAPSTAPAPPAMLRKAAATTTIPAARRMSGRTFIGLSAIPRTQTRIHEIRTRIKPVATSDDASEAVHMHKPLPPPHRRESRSETPILGALNPPSLDSR